MKLLSAAAGFTFFLSVLSARADGAGDKVFLKDGSVLVGKVLSQSGGSVVLRLADGREKSLSWSVVAGVETGAPDAPLGAPPGDGLSVDPSLRVAPASPQSASPKTTATSGSSAAPQAEGLGVGIHKETVHRLKQPKNTAFLIAIDGTVLYGTSLKGPSFNIVGGGADFNVRFRVGQQFPGPTGGSWSGLGLDGSFGIFGAGLIAGNNSAGLLVINGGATAGFQYYHFGTMDDETLKQHGIGLFVGARGGVANTQVFSRSTTSITSGQYGPSLTISFPSYNFGTAARSAFFLSFLVLPTGDFLFTQISAGGEF